MAGASHLGFFQDVPAATVVVKCPIFFLHAITNKPGFPAWSRIPQYITLWEPSDRKRLWGSVLQAVMAAGTNLELDPQPVFWCPLRFGGPTIGLPDVIGAMGQGSNPFL